MVRRGSTVRVRQRASRDRCKQAIGNVTACRDSAPAIVSPASDEVQLAAVWPASPSPPPGHWSAREAAKAVDADGLIAGVVYAVRAGRPYREANDIARFQSLFTFRSPNRWRSSNDEEPLLVAPVEVIRANRLSRRELVDR